MHLKIKKNIEMIAFALLLCVGLFLNRPIKAYAYEESSSYVDEEGNWEVDDADGPSVSVSLYMMVQPDYADSAGFRTYYSFFCTEGDFYYTDGRYEDCEPMIYFFRSENAKVIDTIDDLEVWYWEFNIEPGKYLFSNPEGLGYLTVLTQSLGSPFVRDGYTKAEETVVEEGDHIRLYSMLGDWEWRSAPEQLESLLKYANQREEELTYGHPELQKKDNEDENTVTISVDGTENIPDQENVEENEETFSAVEIETPSTFVETESEPEKDSKFTMDKFWSITKTVLGIAVVAFILFYSRKKKDDD